MPNSNSSAASTSKTLEHGLNVLLCFLNHPHELSLTEIAEILGRNTTSTYRLIQTLTEKGFLTRNPENKKYLPGLALKFLGELVNDHENLVLTAHPYLVRLNQEFNENVTVYVYHNFKRICIDRIESSNPLRESVRIGNELSLSHGAGGTALLAFLPQKLQDSVLRSDPGITPEALENIRLQGYVISRNETNKGISGIGAPIFDKNGNVLAALNMSAPVSRMTEDMIRRGVAAVTLAAREITAELASHS